MEDNNVYVNIKINTDGIKFGTKEVSNAIAKAAQDMGKYGKAAQASCDSAANAFMKQNQAVANANAEVEKLSAELAKVNAQASKTEGYANLEKELNKIENETQNVINKQKDLLSAGGSVNDTAYKNLEKKLNLLGARYDRVQGSMNRMVENGTAYTGSDTSVLETKLAQAKAKQQNAVNSASIAYEKFNNTLDKNKAKLEQTAEITKKTAQASKEIKLSSLNLNKSFKKGLTTILKYGFGLRSLYVAWRKLRSAMIEGFKTLAKENPEFNKAISGIATQLQTLKNSFAAAFAPLVTAIAPIIEAFLSKLNALMQGLSKLIALISGASTYKVAVKNQVDYAKSLEKTGSAAKKAKKYLSGLDEIATFTEKDSSGGGGSSANSFMDMPLVEDQKFKQIKDRINELKKAFKDGWDNGFKTDKLDAVKNNIKEIGDTLVRIWKNPKLESARKDYEDSVARMVGTVAGAAASIGVSLTYGVTEGVKKSLQKNEQYIVDTATNIYKNLTEANDSVSRFAETLAEIGAKVFESESFASLVEKLMDLGTWATGTAAEAATGFFKDMVKWFLDPISNNGDEVSQVLQDIVDILDLLLPNIDSLHHWDYNESGFHKWLQEMISNKSDLMHQKLQTLHDKLQLIKTVMQEIKDQGGLKEWFKSNFSWDTAFKAYAQSFIAGLYTFINAIIDGFNRLTQADARHAMNVISGGKMTWLDKRIPNLQIPQLATGAVIPPNAPFLATLGDQKSGNNFEAPEGLLRQVVREESGSGSYQFTAMINRRVLFDEMITEAKLRQGASGKNPFEFA